MSFSRTVALAAALAAALMATSLAADRVTVSCRREYVVRAGETPVFVVYLPERLVVAGTDSVFIDDRPLLREVDYWVDCACGKIYLRESPSAGSLLRTSYAVFPFSLQPDYSLRRIEERHHAKVLEPRSTKKVESVLKSHGLRASGSKTVSIETGTLKDLQVHQSLNLSIGGKVSDAVEVRGVLSDRDMSLSDRSSTSRLKDLDRVFMEVRSSGAYARVGDLEIEESCGELLGFKRNMTGFFANASLGSKDFAASGAASRSSYQSRELRGIEGISGPYTMTGADGEGADLVRGSEKVWLDGRLMKRGSNEDYTIDYTTGEIYFNTRHMIMDGARIVVDYQSLDRSEKRQFYFGRSALRLGDKVSFALSYAKEGLAASSPEAAEYASYGESAGGGGWVDGGRLVGMGLGSYVRVETDTLAYYEFVGDGAGDYEVDFTLVGEGGGTYSYVFSEDWNRYVHVYTGAGAYVDRVRIPHKLDSQVFHLSASAKPVEWLEITSEGAQSRGGVDTDDDIPDPKEDRAYAVELRSRPDLPAMAGLEVGSVDLMARRRSIGRYYIGFDRLRKPGFLEKWAQEPEDSYEVTDEVGLDYRLGDLVATSFELGSLRTSAGRSRRRRLQLELGTDGFGLSAASEAADMTSTAHSRGFERNHLGVRVPIKFVQLGLGRNSEAKERLTDSTSVRREQYYSSVRVAGSRGAVGLTLMSGSEDRDLARGWLAYSSTVEGRLEFEARYLKRFSVLGGIGQRRIDYSEDAQGPDQRVTSGDLHVKVRDLLAISSMALDYRISNALTTVYGTRFVKVEYGGDYDSLGNYVPGAGGYALSRFEKGKQPVTRVRANLVLELGRGGRVLLDRAVSSRTGIEVEGESSGGRIERIALLSPRYLTGGDAIVFSLVNVNEELVLRRKKGMTVSFNARGSRMLDRRCADRREAATSGEAEARLQGKVFKDVSITLGGLITALRSSVEMPGVTTSPRRDTWMAKMGLEKNIVSNIRGRVRFELLNDDRVRPTSSYMQASLAPGLTAFRGGLRLDTGFHLKRIIRSNIAAGSLTPRRDSMDWNSRLHLRRGTHTSFSVEYMGRRTKGLPTVHDMRASLSATF